MTRREQLLDLRDRLAKATWRPIPGRPYEASDTGLIRSVRTARVLRPSVSHNGYEHVMFSVDGERASFRVHRLVILAWIGPIPPNMHVNHRDGNKRNNVPDNLEIVTGAENERHAVANGLKAAGDRNGVRTHPERIARGSAAANTTLSESAVLVMRAERQTGALLSTLAAKYGLGESAVSKICRRKTWTHI